MSGYFVVDASVAVKWLVPEEESELAAKLLDDATATDTRVLVPPHLPIEVTNALRKKIWRSELTISEADRALQGFLRLDFRITEPPDLYKRSLELANQYGRRAVYDSHYVALAEIVGCDLWTADTGIVNVMARDLPFIKLLTSYV